MKSTKTQEGKKRGKKERQCKLVVHGQQIKVGTVESKQRKNQKQVRSFAASNQKGGGQ